ncbi:MAG: chromosome segregation protein SMC [Armatimonadota bacterium]|nr:chromosome segregation protein SMC [Armatimonadota bacterium]
MRLKSIRIFGFKSFADKVDIDVDDNLVAVVGPNGCGKSNIVDAIQWALGEASGKNLRTGQSTDVIFNGSGQRKPLGYAEVSLVFDNEDKALPVNTTEVIVTRRLDRKGESAYAINRQSCRLKDVYELFADTGLGRTGYAIVSQKDIAATLDAPPQERRVWIDEAAGVQRYRSRKTDALKRLDSAVTHLTRVNDVLAEIERQREPLREQAEAARLYRQHLASLREVESGLLLQEAAALAVDIGRLEAEIVRKRTDSEGLRRESAMAETRSDSIEAEIASVEAVLEAVRAKQQAASTEAERAASRVAVAENRLRSLDQLELFGGREETEARARIERAKEALADARKQVDEEARAIQELLALIGGSADEAKETNRLLRDAEEQLAKARAGELAYIEAEAKRKQSEERRDAVRKELEGARKALPDLLTAFAEAEQALGVASSDLEKSKVGAGDVSKQRQTLSDEIRALEADRRERMAARASLQGRIEGLRASIESHEGLASGPKAVLSASDAGELSGDFVPVASVISVPGDIAHAIEAALGAAAGDLITSHSKHAKAAIEHLKSKQLGRATFLAADLVNPRPRSTKLAGLAARNGILGVAADLVSCSEEHRAAIELLLGGVLVAETIDAATALGREHGFRKIATLEGELVFSGGAVTGGRSAHQGSGPIRLATRHREAEEELATVDVEVAVLDRESKALTEKAAEADQRATEARAESEAAAEAVVEATRWLTAIREEKLSTERAVLRLEQELASIEAIATPEGEGGSSKVDEMEAERNRLLGVAAAKSSDVEQAKRAVSDASEREAAAKARLRLAESELASAVEADQNRRNRLGSVADDRTEQQAALAEAKVDEAAARERVAALVGEVDQQQTRRGELRASVQNLHEETRKWSETIRTLEDAAYRDDISRARAETKRAGSLSRLLEEYSVDESDAIRQAPLVEIPPEAAKVASRIRREIKELGEVNIGAIEAFESLSERWDTLTRERADVLDSKSELDRAVGELDRLTRGAFADCFEKVNAAFQETFEELLGGGEASLELTDPHNMLETGVDVNIRVPGKKTQRLELLSGGERALAACAFLFALLKVKPSPLCVLDELDAPLDGRNVERYVDLLKLRAREAQFIVITHNPTTIEAAPTWFGVTMTEPGVSTVIPYRVPGQARIGEAQESSLTEASA